MVSVGCPPVVESATVTPGDSGQRVRSSRGPLVDKAGENLPAAMSARVTRVTTYLMPGVTLPTGSAATCSGMPVSALMVIASS